MTSSNQSDDLATAEQLDELRTLTPNEEIPAGMRASEAAQRLVELRNQK